MLLIYFHNSSNHIKHSMLYECVYMNVIVNVNYYYAYLLNPFFSNNAPSSSPFIFTRDISSTSFPSLSIITN